MVRHAKFHNALFLQWRKVKKRWKNLKRVEHHLSPPCIPGTWLPGKSFVETFQTNHQVLSLVTGPVAAHVPMSIHHPQLQHPKGMLTSRGIFPVSLITWFIVCRAPNVHRQCTLERLEEGWRTTLGSTAEMSSTEEMTFPYLPISTKPIIHWRTWRLRYWRQA